MSIDIKGSVWQTTTQTALLVFEMRSFYTYVCTAISIKVVPDQSGKVEYERKRLLEIAKKFINYLAIPSSLLRSYSTFPLCSGTTLIEIAVYRSMYSTLIS
jgi:hypothetical protein